jgi:hypothetical protein
MKKEEMGEPVGDIRNAYKVLVGNLKRRDSLGDIGALNIHMHKLNSVVLVRKQTLPTERPPLAGEVNANFCG